MATPTIVEVLSGTANEATIDLTTGSGTAAGDMLVAIRGAVDDGASQLSAPSPGSWTLQATGDTGSDSGVRVFTAVVSSAGSETYTFGQAGNNNHSAILYVLRDADSVDDAAGSASVNAPSVTTTAPDDLLICAWQSDDEAQTSSPPASMTEQADIGGMMSASEVLTSSGSTGTRSISETGTWAAITIAILGSSAAAQQVTPAAIPTAETVPAPTVNVGPTADAGPDQTVTEGDTVNLDGTGSSDPEGSLSYEWTVQDDDGTGLTNADITDRLTATPSFTAPEV